MTNNYAMSRLWAVVTVALAVTVAGCGGTDVVIRNPLNVGAVDPNRIVKQHSYIESERGLPPGSVADEAVLMFVDPQQICIGVSLHEMAPIDLLVGKITLTSAIGDVQQGQISAEPPTATTFNGLVPVRRQAGYERFCSSYYRNGACAVYHTRPYYRTFRVPGPVSVFNTRGRVCFANQGQATAITEWLGLDVRLVTTSTMWGTSTKEMRFRWGFTNPKRQ